MLREAIKNQNEDCAVVVLCARTNVELLLAQAEEFRPALVCIEDEKAAKSIASKLPQGVEMVCGKDASNIAASYIDADVVVNGISGFAGTKPLLSALYAGKRVALANKESIVCTGSLVKQAMGYGGEIIPVDSEQSALFQCLMAGQKNEVKRLLLTASGGPFSTYSKSDLHSVTVADALKHPTWNMGAKITIDSATLFNKGLEIIEAGYLFNIEPSRVQAIIHPESVVHSMVEYVDSSVIAQLSMPDMRLAIGYAIFYPTRRKSDFGALDLADVGKLTFEAVDEDKFPSIPLAYDALRMGGGMPAVYNAANEVAVERFISGEIRFTDIFECVANVMGKINNRSMQSFEDILDIDGEARCLAGRIKN